MKLFDKDTYTFKVDSKYKPEAIAPNLKDIQSQKAGVGVVRNMTVFPVTHTLVMDGKTINCNIVIAPHHDGSRVIVTAAVPLTAEDPVAGEPNTVDAIPQINAVVKKLTAMIND